MIIQSTRKRTPLRMVVYGPDGVGKSTFCAAAERPVFISLENGLASIDAMAVPAPASWVELIASVDYLRSYDGCGTIVIDSLDWAEQLCWAHVCAEGDDKGKKKDIEAFGYGKGYVAALQQWRLLLSSLDSAHKCGKTILLICHSHRKAVKNPSGEDYEQLQIKLNDKASAVIREWCDVVGFADLDVATITDASDGGRTKGVSTGKRVLRVHPAAGVQAKTRYALPARINLDWPSFSSAMDACTRVEADLPLLISELSRLLVLLDSEDVSQSCTAYLGDNPTPVMWVKSIETVKGYLATKGGKSR